MPRKSNNVDPAAGASGMAAAVRKKVGQVSLSERDEIRALDERRNALLELFKTLVEMDPINHAAYEKLVADLGSVTARFSRWWSAKSRHYGWESMDHGRWEIDFDDGAIYLVGASHEGSRAPRRGPRREGKEENSPNGGTAL